MICRLLTSFDTLISGAGGSRTRVQTYARYAFYMFISEFDLGRRPEPDKPTSPLSVWVFVRAPQRRKAYSVFGSIRRRGAQQITVPAALMTTLISD